MLVTEKVSQSNPVNTIPNNVFKKIFMDLFKDFENELTWLDINNPDFESDCKVHDWRNYVPTSFRDNWNKLTKRERKIIFVIAKIGADKEEWD